MAMTMHVTHDQHVVKAATLAHDELSRSQVMHWHAYGPLWWPVVALMTRPQHLEHHPWTTEHGGAARLHRRAGVLEVMVIMFMSMGEAQSLPKKIKCSYLQAPLRD